MTVSEGGWALHLRSAPTHLQPFYTLPLQSSTVSSSLDHSEQHSNLGGPFPDCTFICQTPPPCGSVCGHNVSHREHMGVRPTCRRQFFPSTMFWANSVQGWCQGPLPCKLSDQPYHHLIITFLLLLLRAVCPTASTSYPSNEIPHSTTLALSQCSNQVKVQRVVTNHHAATPPLEHPI